MIILLNGASSAGKTSLSRALQAAHSNPLLYLGIDSFCEMLPKKYLWYAEQAHEGIAITKDTSGTVTITSGPVGNHLFTTAPHIISAWAEHGHDLIIDEVILSKTYLEAYADALSQHTVYFIKVHAPIAVMEKREKDRGNRTIGMTRSQAVLTHAHNYAYDFEIDTSTGSPEEGAQQILEYIMKHPSPQGFAAIASQID